MKKIFLVRHGESSGNKDHKTYLTRPDYAIQLTHKGSLQAQEVGKELREKEGRFTCFVSSHHRAKQTLYNALNQIEKERVTKVIETPSIREQEWTGSLGSESDWDFEKERVRIGVFCYRFAGGESCADVFDRMKMFINFDLIKELEGGEDENIAIFTHGMTMRVMLMALLGLTVEQFEKMKNPKNCEIWELEYENGEFKLITEIRHREEGLPFPYNHEEYTHHGA